MYKNIKKTGLVFLLIALIVNIFIKNYTLDIIIKLGMTIFIISELYAAKK